MAYNDVFTRAGLAALNSEDFQREIVQNATESSAVMRLARRLPNLSTNQRRIPVMNSLPTAYWVDGDTGLKQTTLMSWENVYLNIAELAVIVPIPDAVLDDANYDIWGETRPRINEAMGIAFDLAVLHGTNAPADFPDDIVTQSTAAGHNNSLAAFPDAFDAIMGVGGVIADVEEDGFMVNGHIAGSAMRAQLRSLRASDGTPIFVSMPQERTRYALDGEPVEFVRSGGLDTSEALMISGDWSQLVYAIRQDVTFTIANTGVIQDAAGNIVYNLFQQDMSALRAVLRIGWALPNPISRANQTAATRLPFAHLTA